MPELPEVERARQAIEAALDREIRAVDDSDEWVCRPHRPGDIAHALVGGRLVAAHRRGKTMWCDTARSDGEPGPRLGVHLGMGGWIVDETPAETPSEQEEVEEFRRFLDNASPEDFGGPS